MAVKKLTRKRKIWFNIISPKELGNYTIGETMAVEPQQLVGRNVRVNLMSILNDPKKQNVQITFNIKSVRDKNAITEIVRYELQPSYLKRMVRAGRNKVEDSFIAETKDKIKIRIKPVMITRSKTQRSKLALVRTTAKQHIIEKIETQNFTDLITDAVSTKMQRELRDKIKKIYPLALCEFKAITRL